MLKRLPIRLKLILLAGVPVIGALILATTVAREARHQAQSAAAIGSIEDLARLSSQMAKLLHALQMERNELALRIAQKQSDTAPLRERFAQTDAARERLQAFLAARKVSNLPSRLARDLTTAEAKLSALQKQRDAAMVGELRIDELLSYYKTADLTLISATAALAQLAEDGELLRAISALVIVLQLKERASQEHAILSHVFALNEFPAGTFKELVTVTTEEAVYADTLKVDATDDMSRRLERLLRAPELGRTAELRKVALDSTIDDFNVAPEEWSTAQGKKIERLRSLEIELNDGVRSAAIAKVAQAARSVRLSYGLGGSVVLFSALLAAFIARGVSRSVANLARAAEQVSEKRDFSVRARKTTDDELGRLTDAWNEMLTAIQARDQELREHQENLELLVVQRTEALQARNQAMRLVLDNVEQGLATVELDGRIAPERSRAFEDWFGDTIAQPSFADVLASGDIDVGKNLKACWEQVTDGFIPVECAIEQMPRKLEVAGRSYGLSYKLIFHQEELRGALLVVSDVTSEKERLRRDAEQRELIAVFERMMQDRGGFEEFFGECEGLVARVITASASDQALRLRALHTLKGNCALFGVASVAAVAHGLESAMRESGGSLSVEQEAELTSAWQAFSAQVRGLSVSKNEPVLEITHAELRDIEAAVESRTPHAKLLALLERLRCERGIVRLRRVAEQAKSVAQRLGKGELDVQIKADPEVRFRSERWAPFWSCFVHAVRNAVDHGVESTSARRAAHKSEHPKLTLLAEADAKTLTIALTDDGRGIDWERIREKAREHALPCASEQDLVDALFFDGLSTAQVVTEISGRGVGMSAVRDAATQLGGVVSVSSTLGTGTTIRFRFPIAEATRVTGAPPARLAAAGAPEAGP